MMALIFFVISFHASSTCSEAIVIGLSFYHMSSNVWPLRSKLIITRGAIYDESF